MNTQELQVLFEGQLVGVILNPVPDMWYLDGAWRSAGVAAFDELLSRQNLKENFARQDGIPVTYREGGIQEYPALAYGLADGNLLLRRMASPST